MVIIVFEPPMAHAAVIFAFSFSLLDSICLNEWLDLFNVFFRILTRDCSETCSCRYLPYCMLQLHNEIWLC
jgi:hypothetical protein